MRIYHISNQRYKDLRPLILQPHADRRIKELTNKGVSRQSLDDYIREVNFMLGKPTRSQIQTMVKAGFKNWGTRSTFVYGLDIRSIVNPLYVRVTSTPESTKYDTEHWDKFYDSIKDLTGEQLSNARREYIANREHYLFKKYGIKTRMTVMELINHPLLQSWPDWDTHFNYNLRHGNKDQYASHIPHIQVAVETPIAYSTIQEIKL